MSTPKDLPIAVGRTKAPTRVQVEHLLLMIKNRLRHLDVFAKGLVKNSARVFSRFGLANLALSKKLFLPHGEAVRPMRAKRTR